jgi:hypothetical protein
MSALDGSFSLADDQIGTNLTAYSSITPILAGGIAAVGYNWGKSRQARALAFVLGCGASLGYEYATSFLGKGGRF